MKYKTLNSGLDFLNENNIIYAILKSRGVDDPQELLNVNKSHIHDGMLMKNMKEGIELLHFHVQEGNNIHVQIDTDADGFSSSVEIINYIKKVDKKAKITYSFHKGKEHGIILETLKGFKFDLLIVPDAGSNDVEESKELRQKGIDVLILDHHEIEIENTYATLINCKDGQYPNPTLSGAGVVYKFCKEYDKKYGYNYADEFLDVVALGNIGDQMDLRNYETRYIVLEGLKRFGKNKFLEELMKGNEYQIKGKINISKVGWNIAPFINAVIRTGTQEEKIDTFHALLGKEEYREYKPRKSKNNPNPSPIKQSLQEYMAREVGNIKGRQDRIVKKAVAEINEKIKEKKLDENKVLMVDVTDILGSTYTGLVANKLVSQYKRPVLLLRAKKDSDSYGGSARNYSLSPIIDFKQFLNDLGTFEMLAGHSNAFGHSIHIDKLTETRDKLNELLKDMKTEDVYKVDYEIPVGRLKQSHVKQIGEWEDLWGNMIDEPLFAITDVYIPTSEIKLLGEKKNFIRFESKGVQFVKRFANEDAYNRMVLKQEKGLKKQVKNVKLDIIGKFKKNEWEGNVSYQVEIIDFNSVENKREFLF